MHTVFLLAGRPSLFFAALSAHPAPRLCSSNLAKSKTSVMQPVFCEPPHPASLSLELLLTNCQVTHTRGSGPGGQHRNKVSTAVVLKHTPTGVSASASESRSQQQNQKAALQRLRLRLALQLRCEHPGDPSALWRSRCAGDRLSINEAHTDFPSLLAEALDHFWVSQDMRAAADTLGVSSSQLCKLLSRDPPTFAWVNDVRREQGLRPLRLK